MPKTSAQAARWLLLLLALAAAVACVPRGPVMTERDLPPETAQPTPSPAATETDAPTTEDEQALAALLANDANNKKAKSARKTGQPAGNDNSSRSDIQERNINEAPAAPEPAVAPPPVTREPMPHQSALSAASASQLDAAYGAGGGPRNRAALALAREGRQKLAENDVYLAEKRFEKALSVDASCGQAMLGLAEVRFAQEKWQQAGAMATRAALHLSKSSYFLARAHLVAARAFINADRPDAALQQLRKAVEADPDNEEARLLKISLEAHLGVQPQ